MSPVAIARLLGRSALRAVLVAAVGAVFLLAGAAPAWAHASLVGTDPPDGAVLATAPSTVTLTFSEQVGVDSGGVRLLAPDGTELSSTVAVVDNRVVITPGELGTGTVIVSWQVVSADSHPISGGFTFAIGERTAGSVGVPTADEDLTVRILAAAAQALAYLGVLAACGLVAFDVLVLRSRSGDGQDPEARRRMRRVATWCAWAGVAGTFLLLPLTELRQRFETVAGLLRPETWLAPLGRDAGLTFVLVAAGLLVALEAEWIVQERTAISTGIALAGSGLALGAFAVVGHTRGYGPVALTLTADLLHLTVAAFWFGGLIGLSLVLRTAAPRGSAPARTPAAVGAARGAQSTPAAPRRATVDTAAVAVQRFSGIAALLVGTLVVTGTLQAWRVLGSWQALWSTGYGATLLIKVGLAAVAVGVAGYNRFRALPGVRAAATPGAGWRRLRAAVTVEAGALVAVLLVTGWLVSASPALDTAASAAAASSGAPVERSAALGEGTVTARVTPGATGINSLELTITDAGGAPVAPVTDPELSVSLPAVGVGPLSRPVTATGLGTYQAVLDLPIPGEWAIDVAVRTGDFEQSTARIPVEIP